MLGPRLLALAAPPRAAPSAVVVALHGVNDHARVFAAAAAVWAQEGIVTYGYDQRGFGATAQRGEWPGVAAMVEDLPRALEEAGRRHPGVPCSLVGHSMGAAVAAVALAAGGWSSAPASAVLLAPAVWSRDDMPAAQRVALAAAHHIGPRLRLGGGLVPRPASDNRSALRHSRRDPLVIQRPRVAVLAGLADLMDQAQRSASRLTGRVLVCYGLRDLVVPAAAVRRFWSRLPGESEQRRRQRLAVYPDGWHWLHRDLHSGQLLRDVAAWIRDPDLPLPSRADRAAAERLRDRR